jgi:hypothetical protein
MSSEVTRQRLALAMEATRNRGEVCASFSRGGSTVHAETEPSQTERSHFRCAAPGTSARLCSSGLTRRRCSRALRPSLEIRPVISDELLEAGFNGIFVVEPV